jgi:hypothetical protein
MAGVMDWIFWAGFLFGASAGILFQWARMNWRSWL